MLGFASPLHLTAEGSDTMSLAGDPDPELLCVIVAAITLVEVDAASFDPGQLLQFGDHRPPCVTVKRNAVQALGGARTAGCRMMGLICS